MWRRIFIRVGEFIRGVLSLNTILTIYSIAGGGYIIVNIFVGVIYSPKSSMQIALEVLVIFFWLLLFFVVTDLSIRGLERFLLWAGNYYPNWYYFPKIDMFANITPKNDIEVTITNPKKRQKISLQAIYGLIRSDIKIPIGLESGVAPDEIKQLLPLAPMNGNSSRMVIIGRVEDKCLILFGGKKIVKEMRFTAPGLYNYFINIYGSFR
jgi:hypothetical protein